MNNNLEILKNALAIVDDCTVCPYCGQDDTDFVDAVTNEKEEIRETRRCLLCDSEYDLMWNKDADSITDILDCDNHTILPFVFSDDKE